MKGSPTIDDTSTGDESSDIRTVRSNATHVFSQSSYYTNPTLPASILERLEADDVSSLGGADHVSPTSIMTNYESYSKFGAAPIYQTVAPPTKVKPGKSKSVTPENNLKPIAEEELVYHNPSFYKGKRHGEAISNIAISASKSIVEDGSILTEPTTTSRSILTEKTATTAATLHVAEIQNDETKKEDPATTKSNHTAAVSVWKRILAKSPVRNSPVRRDGSARNNTTMNRSHRAAPPIQPFENQNSPPQKTSVVPSQPSDRAAKSPAESEGSHTSTNEPYVNPTLQSVSSKLFDTTAAPPELRLESPKQKFRLWTDEDSAVGAAWYNFHAGTSYFGTANPPPAAALVAAAPTIPDAAPTTTRKLSLSRLQLKQMHRGTSVGTGTITDADTMNSRGGYPSMVSSEYEDETCFSYNGEITDDFTTLGGSPSLDFSVSACLDDESHNKTRASPIVYSNVGQAFSRSDMMMPMPPTSAGGLLSPTMDRPSRVRRTSTISTIEENAVISEEQTSGDTAMQVVSVAEASFPSSSREEESAVKIVTRKFDACQIGIIVILAVALAAVICVIFCLVGSCQLGGQRRLRGASGY